MGVSVGMPGNQNVHHIPLQGGRITPRNVRLCHRAKEYSTPVHLRHSPVKPQFTATKQGFCFFICVLVMISTAAEKGGLEPLQLVFKKQKYTYGPFCFFSK